LVPLATPAVAGPSALAMLITLRTTFDGPLWELYLAVVLAWAATALILLQAAMCNTLRRLSNSISTLSMISSMP
ncbi:MarC family protein, partial [Pseudomonas aeruginosa]